MADEPKAAEDMSKLMERPDLHLSLRGIVEMASSTKVNRLKPKGPKYLKSQEVDGG